MTEGVEASEAEAEEQAAETDDGQPGIDSDQMADLDAIAEKVQSETVPDDDPQAADTEEADDSDDEQKELWTPDEDAEGSTETPEGETVGDMYVDALTSVSNLVIEEHGRDGADPIDGSKARQLGLDDAIDRLLAERGQMQQMKPEHQVIICTLIFLVTVLGTKTDLFDQLLADADLSL